MNLYGYDTTGYIGILDPQRHLVRARYVSAEGHPAGMVDALRRIWATTASGDTTRLITTVLAHDWDRLDPTITPITQSGRPDRLPVTGVGIALTDDEPEPPCAFPLSQARLLDVDWIYLLDPCADTVTIHTDDGDPVGVHPLAM